MIDQAEKLRRQLNRQKKGKTISIVSGKGGVGKSNFAINFSIELLNQDQRVLLFDLDIGMGNIDTLLGLHTERTIVDMIEKELPIHDIIETGPQGLAYISGGSSLQSFFKMNQRNRDYFYEQYQQLLNTYDYIIFDMGAGATSESIFFVLASDECIVITTPEPTSITDAYGMIKYIVNNQRNMPIYVVMNRCHLRKSGESSLDKFQQVVLHFLQIKVKKLGILMEDKNVSTAVMKQTPFILMNEKSSISRALKNIVHYYLSEKSGFHHSSPDSFVQKLIQLLKER